MGTGPTRVYRPDLSDHFILVHPGRQWGIISFYAQKTKAVVQAYHFDEDGDLRLGQRRRVEVKRGPKGPHITRSQKVAYLHDFVKAYPNPYA